jgi:phenylacetate-coenzyme A ligase PaaK-like adenylate-forming protein
MPDPIQTANRFDDVCSAVARRSACTSEELAREASDRLVACLLHHLRGANPAWRDVVRVHGIGEANLPRTAAELARIPLVTRSFLREGRFNERPNAPIFHVVSTSGSTHTAVQIAHNVEMSRATLFDNFLRLLALNGAKEILPFYGIGHWGNDEITGSRITFTFMSEHFGGDARASSVNDPLDETVARIRALGPRTVASAPGFMTLLAGYLMERGEQIPIPRVIVGGGPLTIIDRRHMERAFAPEEVLVFYPSTDAGGLGARIEASGEYVSFPETHIFEVVRTDGSHVKEGEDGLVAVTALDSLATPLIRYLVGDRVTYLGRTETGGRVRFRNLRRITDAVIGHLKVPLAEIDSWRDQLVQRGIEASALQLVTRRDARARERITVRVETKAGRAEVEAALLEIILAEPSLGVGLESGYLASPRIEIFAPGELLRGRFKLPVFVDESARIEQGL